MGHAADLRRLHREDNAENCVTSNLKIGAALIRVSPLFYLHNM